ncbi:transcription factor of the MADS box [Coemansia sp. RSA 922]|nr:transcription factor of the MADS box [Coemansia sp. S680]KAJ2054892.1 transcription factor of the MADS box [Coemansia sp. S155-1]KAJ2102910.1 transcription factor of the MADS box [Coemansia sp. RSA 922]
MVAIPGVEAILMYAYDSKLLGYPDNLSISSTDTAAPTPPTSSSLGSAVSTALSHGIFKMNTAFIPEDPSRLSGQAATYSPVDSGSAGADMLMEHHHHHHHPLHHVQQQQQQLARFSADSRTQTPPLKRLREGDDSDAGESESNHRHVIFNGSTNGNGDVDGDGAPGDDGPNDKRAGRRKIKIEFIEDKSRRHITFSKRKAGIMKKAYELSTLTGTQVLLLVVSETGLVYTFTTPKLQPIVTQCDGKNLIQACLSVPDQPGDHIPQPIPTESNTYMSQPRHSNSHTSSATAMATAAGAGVSLADPHDMHHHFGDERKPGMDSPVGNNLNPAAVTSYLPYAYGHNTIAQAAAVSAVGADMGGSSGMQQYHAAAVVAAGAVPGYASYPGSTSQSQHHSPITSATQHNTPQPTGEISAAAVAIPGMGSLASYHHGGYSHPQQQQHLAHYGYQQQNPQPHYQQLPQAHYAHQHQTQGSAPGTPATSNSSVNAAVAAAAAAAGGQQGLAANVSYMNAGHYWSHTAAGIASPHHHHQPPSSQQQQTSPTTLLQRTGYANGN